MLGLWELRNILFLKKVLTRGGCIIKENMVIFDVGANIGMYSLWFSGVLPRTTAIYGFECVPRICDIFSDSLKLNNVENVHIMPLAVVDHSGDFDIYLGRHHHQTSIHKDWASGGGKEEVALLKVKGETLDALVSDICPSSGPDLIKMDIEGGGTLALTACDRCFGDRRPLMIIESHTPEEDRAISNLILKYDYGAYRVSDDKWVKDRKAVYPEAEGVWGVLFVYPGERHTSIVKAIGTKD